MHRFNMSLRLAMEEWGGFMGQGPGLGRGPHVLRGLHGGS